MEDRLWQWALGAGIIAALFAFLEWVPTLFGLPPPDRQTVKRAIAEIFVALPISFITALAFAEPLSLALTSAVQIIFKGVEVNVAAASVIIGYVGVRGIGSLVEKTLGRFIDGKLRHDSN